MQSVMCNLRIVIGLGASFSPICRRISARSSGRTWPQWRGSGARRRGVGVHGAGDVARAAHEEMAGDRRPGSRLTGDLRQSPRRPHAARQSRSRHGVRSRVGQATVAGRRRCAVHDELGGDRSRSRAQVDAPHRRRPRLHARHQRHLLRARSGHRQVAVAQGRAADAARVRHRDLADRGRQRT